VGYVDAGALRSIAALAGAIKARALTLLDPQPGQRLLDVGCGPGLDTVELAAFVGMTGAVVGLDHDAAMVRTARAAARRGRAQRIRHLVGDGLRLPLAEGAFDGCRCDRVLQHVADPAGLVSELVRVTRPGGTVVAIDTDWASLSIDCADTALERHITRQVADTFANGYAGRQLARRLRDAGLAITATEVWPIHWDDLASFRRTSFPATSAVQALVASGRVTGPDWDRFFHAVDTTAAGRAFFASATVVMVAGRKAATALRKEA
jgi:ubiquinone/menaquinone biosynthesis C-methylase UbiE